MAMIRQRVQDVLILQTVEKLPGDNSPVLAGAVFRPAAFLAVTPFPASRKNLPPRFAISSLQQ